MAVRLIVCGGRDYANRAHVFATLGRVHAARCIVEVIHGAARGADTLAGEWAAARGIRCTPVPADWSTHGRRAGPLRNRAMLRLNPDGVVAFPGGRGTADMITAARAAGVPVMQVPRRHHVKPP